MSDLLPELAVSQALSRYLKVDAVSRGRVDIFMDSRRKYHARFVKQSTADKPPSDTFQLGTASHAWVLEPEVFDRRFVEIPSDLLSGDNQSIASNEAKAFVKNARENGLEPLKPKSIDKIKRIRRFLLQNEKAAELIMKAKHVELSHYWQDEETGLKLKSRTDFITDVNGDDVIIDLKILKDVSLHGFRKASFNYGYHRQAAQYREGVKQTLGVDLPFVFMCVEKEEPHIVRFYELHSGDLALGRRQLDWALREIAECTKTGNWADEDEGKIITVQYDEWMHTV